MPKIDRNQVKRMIDENAVTLVEVLDEAEFENFHLPGALNVPIGRDFKQEIRETVPDLHEPVVVYCRDEDCDASSRAARAMEDLGYDRVYDYDAGKTDWKDAGLRVEAS